jgi:hypothetical protein
MLFVRLDMAAMTKNASVPMRRHVWVGVVLACVLSASAVTAQADSSAAALGHSGLNALAAPVPDFDLRQMRAKEITQRQMRQPVVQWETVAGDYAGCPQSTSGTDLDLPQQGCAVVNTAKNNCTIYTSSRTTHSIMGHLIRHCFEGRL